MELPKTNLKAQTMMSNCHIHDLLPNQCGSVLVRTVDAPLPLVWSMIRRFDCPQAYKRFIKSCTMLRGTGGTGSVREILVISGLPATTSTKRLEKLDDDFYVTVVSIIGGDHRLENYHSRTTLRETEGGKTEATDSFVVDIPAGSSKEDTCTFADTIIGCNLKSLASVSEKMVIRTN